MPPLCNAFRSTHDVVSFYLTNLQLTRGQSGISSKMAPAQQSDNVAHALSGAGGLLSMALTYALSLSQL